MTVHLQSPARFFGQFFSFIFNPAQAVAVVILTNRGFEILWRYQAVTNIMYGIRVYSGIYGTSSTV